jgi:hypothetical protein
MKQLFSALAVAAMLCTLTSTPAMAQAPPSAPVPTPPRPTACDQPEYRQFDFWLGEWEVTPVGAAPNAPRPQSRIEKILNGCVILENWMPPGGAGGKSFNIYNRQTQKWEQFWVDSSGSAIRFTGEVRDGNMYYTTESTAPSGGKTLGRMTFFNLGPDRVRQLWEQSRDGGKTWSVAFDGMYNRKK